MMQSLIIIDNFLNDPHQLRALALQQAYPAGEKQELYPGYNSKYSQHISGLDEKISEIVGEQLIPAGGEAHQKFRLALKGQKGAGGVHIDNNHWTSILYLTLPENCKDGTHLHRHIPTNTDRAPFWPNEFEKYNAPSPEDLFETVEILLKTDGCNPDKWEKLLTIPMKFNRMLLFRPQQWHDAGISFGDTPENGRLVYLNFYNSAG